METSSGSACVASGGVSGSRDRRVGPVAMFSVDLAEVRVLVAVDLGRGFCDVSEMVEWWWIKVVAVVSDLAPV